MIQSLIYICWLYICWYVDYINDNLNLDYVKVEKINDNKSVVNHWKSLAIWATLITHNNADIVAYFKL